MEHQEFSCVIFYWMWDNPIWLEVKLTRWAFAVSFKLCSRPHSVEGLTQYYPWQSAANLLFLSRSVFRIPSSRCACTLHYCIVNILLGNFSFNQFLTLSLSLSLQDLGQTALAEGNSARDIMSCHRYQV